MHSISELNQYLSTLPNAPQKYRIAVGALIFTLNGKVILQERGKDARDKQGKLEGIGGGVEENETDLHQALQREIKEEIGNVEVSVDDLLTVMVRPSTVHAGEWWAVPIYLCRLISGEPAIMEPHKCAAIHTLNLNEIADDLLTEYQKETMDVYKAKYADKPFYLSS